MYRLRYVRDGCRGRPELLFPIVRGLGRISPGPSLFPSTSCARLHARGTLRYALVPTQHLIMPGVDISKYDGQVFAMYPHPEGGGCVKCMLGTMTCCTYKYEWTFVVIDKDTMAGKNHTAAGCCMPSPCPCCFGLAMCLPPCRQYTIHTRSPTDPTAFVANGTSVFQGGCCAALCNQGDTTFWMSENLDGAAAPFVHRACAPTPAAERYGSFVPSRIKLGH